MLSYERIDDFMSLLTVSFEHIYVLWEHPGGQSEVSIFSNEICVKI